MKLEWWGFSHAKMLEKECPTQKEQQMQRPWSVGMNVLHSWNQEIMSMPGVRWTGERQRMWSLNFIVIDVGGNWCFKQVDDMSGFVFLKKSLDLVWEKVGLVFLAACRLDSWLVLSLKSNYECWIKEEREYYSVYSWASKKVRPWAKRRLAPGQISRFPKPAFA